jgi:catalase
VSTLPAAEAIDRLRRAFGRTEGNDGKGRTLHAKGVYAAGVFTASPRAAELCRAAHLQGSEVPVLVRWSNAGGDPTVKDGAPDIRGMAVSFRPEGGPATDLVAQTAPRFVARTPEAFVEFTEAARAPRRLVGWLLRHPEVLGPLVANGRAKALSAHRSYATIPYYPIHAYRWLDADGKGVWVRHTLRPETTASSGEHVGRDRLRADLAARLSAGSVSFSLSTVVAADRDYPHDPMSVWHGREAFDAGTIQVTGLVEDPEPASVVVFDPTRVVDGIELSDDPILRYRALAYSESVSRRV